jgi:4-amino-4-deoxy-L-arabinose transferase-like glycosyltransferase
VLFALAQRLHPRSTEPGRLDIPSAYAAQAALGTALVPAVFVLAALLAGPAAGVLAAGAVAFYPPLITASTHLLTEPLGALMIALALIAVVLALRRPGGPTFATTGAAALLLGLAVLVRADLLLAPVAVCALLAGVAWRRAGRGAALRAGAGALAGLALTMGAWSAYASVVAGRPVPVSSGGASNLYVGTYLPGDGSMFGLKHAWAQGVAEMYPGYRGMRPHQIPQVRVIDAVAAERPGLSREAALRAAAMENLRRYAIGEPGAFATMAARKVQRLWLEYSVGTHRNRRDWIQALHVALLLIGTVGLLTGLAVTRGRSAELWAIGLVLLYITATNAVLVSEARHNLPYMPLLAAGGAAGLALAAARVRRARPVLEPHGGAITIRRLTPAERAGYAEGEHDAPTVVRRDGSPVA